MRYLTHPPPAALMSFIKCYWSLTDFSSVPGGHKNLFLTDGGIELVFNLGDPFTVVNHDSQLQNKDGAFGIGTMTKAQLGYTTGICDLFGVCFLPGGAIPFLSSPPVELRDRCFDVEEFWNTKINGLAARLRNTSDGGLQARVDLLNQFFSRWLDRPSSEYQLLFNAMRMIRQSNGRGSIEMLAQRLGISRRRLERLFLKMTGISPKKMSRLLRINHAINHMANLSVNGAAELALSAGFFDQAHFIREFKLFTGLTPSVYCGFQPDVIMFKPVNPAKTATCPGPARST